MNNADIAKKIVSEIENDFTDRRGLRQEWDQIDDDIKNEIREEWASITRKVLEENI